jgi:hypothetical protein
VVEIVRLPLGSVMGQAGDVIYTDVDRQGGGIVEFASKADQVRTRERGTLDKVARKQYRACLQCGAYACSCLTGLGFRPSQVHE